MKSSFEHPSLLKSSFLAPCGLGISALAFIFPPAAPAALVGPSIIAGTVSFAQSGSTENVTNSPGAIINWQQFSIAAGNTVDFKQNSATSRVLNRVTGGSISQIMGKLISNGQVFLINPAGIVFGQGSVVNTAGLIASTLNISDADFENGVYNFKAGSIEGSVLNQGSVTLVASGSALLFGKEVQNSGIIQVDKGSVILAAGQSVNISNLTSPQLTYIVTAPSDQAVNLNQIIATGGTVILRAEAVTSTGTVSTVATAPGGVILLQGNSAVTASGSLSGKGSQITVESSGTTTVSATVSNSGGSLTLSGQGLNLNKIKLLLSGGNSYFEAGQMTLVHGGTTAYPGYTQATGITTFSDGWLGKILALGSNVHLTAETEINNSALAGTFNLASTTNVLAANLSLTAPVIALQDMVISLKSSSGQTLMLSSDSPAGSMTFTKDVLQTSSGVIVQAAGNIVQSGGIMQDLNSHYSTHDFVKVSGAEVTLSGSVITQAGGNSGEVTLQALSGNLTESGSIIVGTSPKLPPDKMSLTVSAAQNLQISGVVQSAPGNNDLFSAKGNLLSSGQIVTNNGSLSLEAGGTLTQTASGELNSKALSLQIRAGTGTLLAGSLNAGQALTLISGGNVTSSATISSTGGTISLLGADGTLVQTDGRISALGAIAVSGGATALAGPIQSQTGAITLKALSGNFTGSGTITTQSGNITMSAARDMTLNGGVVSSGSGEIILNSSGNLLNEIPLTATAGNVSLTVDGTFMQTATGTVTAAGTSQGRISLLAEKGALLAGNLTAGSSFNAFIAGGNSETSANITAITGNISITDSGAFIQTGGHIVSGSGVFLLAGATGTDISTMNSSVYDGTLANLTTTPGDIVFGPGVSVGNTQSPTEIVAADNIRLKGPVFGTSLEIRAETGTLVSSYNLTANSGNLILYSGSASAPLVLPENASSAGGNTEVATKNILQQPAGATLSAITGTANILADQGGVLQGTISGATGVSINFLTGTLQSAGRIVAANGNVTIDPVDGSINQTSGKITATVGNIYLAADGTLDQSAGAEISAPNGQVALLMNNGGTLQGTISGSSGVTVHTLTGTLLNQGTMTTSGGTLAVYSRRGNIEQTAGLITNDSGTVYVTTGGTVTQTGGEISAPAGKTVIAGAGGVSLTGGTVLAAQNAVITTNYNGGSYSATYNGTHIPGKTAYGTGNITLAENIRGNTGVTVVAGAGDVTQLSGTLSTTAGNIFISAGAGFIQNKGAVLSALPGAALLAAGRADNIGHVSVAGYSALVTEGEINALSKSLAIKPGYVHGVALQVGYHGVYFFPVSLSEVDSEINRPVTEENTVECLRNRMALSDYKNDQSTVLCGGGAEDIQGKRTGEIIQKNRTEREIPAQFLAQAEAPGLIYSKDF